MDWFTSDTHFGHCSIIKHCRRPFSDVNEMDATLIKNWNTVVSKKDTVYHLGDFAWCNHNHYLGALNGKKILIRGNHDKMNQDYLRNFSGVHDILQKTFNQHMVVMMHYPLWSWNACFHGSWHIFGHVHGRLRGVRDGELCLDVGVDSWNYYPVSWDELEKSFLKIIPEWKERRDLYRTEHPSDSLSIRVIDNRVIEDDEQLGEPNLIQ